VAVAAGIYGIGYARGALQSRVTQAVFPLFVLAMLRVPAAASVGTFAVCWELTALASLLLVVAEHRLRPAVASAGRWYAVMTHLGFVTILVGLLVFAANAGGDTFAALRAAHLSPGMASLVFLLTLAGFSSKAGCVPLHAWLPRAHPEAPSHVSALMSAAMVNRGAYGIARTGLDLLGGGPRWWWIVVLALGAASAVYGILQAVLNTDLKRLLGYSTTENLGLARQQPEREPDGDAELRQQQEPLEEAGVRSNVTIGSAGPGTRSAQTGSRAVSHGRSSADPA
jgi:hydrogenase-4 component B